jgi:hypothetical protein
MPVHHEVDTRECCRLIDILFILAMTAPLALCASSSSVGMDPVALRPLRWIDYKPIPDAAVHHVRLRSALAVSRFRRTLRHRPPASIASRAW